MITDKLKYSVIMPIKKNMELTEIEKKLVLSSHAKK